MDTTFDLALASAIVRSAMYYGPRDIRIEEVPDPVAAPAHVVIDVACNGICGSDLHTYVGSSTGGPSMHVAGVVLGHEFSGTVTAVGPGVDDIEPGAFVTVAPLDWCGTCWPCLQGWPNLCRHLALYGGYRRPLHGGLAAQVAVQRRALFPVPRGLAVGAAALAEPVAVAVHAVRRADPSRGATALVLGCGPVGLSILQCLRADGASCVIAVDLARARRDAAACLGADVVLDPSLDDAVAAVRDVGGPGADLVFDTTGADAAIDLGIAAARPRATFVNVAGWQRRAQLDMGRMMAKEIDFRFTMTYEPAVDFPVALDLLASGAVDADAMISDHIPLERLVDRGLEELLHNADGHIKIMVDGPAAAAGAPRAPASAGQ